MRLSGLKPRHFASVVGAIGLAVGCRVFAEGSLAGEVRQTSTALQATAGRSNAETPTVHQCGAARQLTGEQPQQQPQDLMLKAQPGIPLQFQCGASKTLHPVAVEKKFVNVYKYTAGGECKSGQNVLLNDELSGATLKKTGEADRPKVTDVAGPDVETYEFRYDSEPAVEKLLCYTCNVTTNTEVTSDQVEGTNAEKCTVFIKVPQKTATSTATASTPASTTHSTTASPSSETSGAPALRAALGTSAGVALGLMLLV